MGSASARAGPAHYIETWLRSHTCDSDTQIRTAGQESTAKQEDPVWKFLQANAHFIRTIRCNTPFHLVEERRFHTSFLALRTWASSGYTCIVLFLAFVRYQRNRRRKVLNREALRLCRGSWQKIHWFIVFQSSIWGPWKFVWWGRSPPKSPLAAQLVTKRHLFHNPYYQTVANSSNWEQLLF